MFEYRFCIGKQEVFNDAAVIRQEIFVVEQGFNNEFDDIDEYAVHLVVYEQDKPVATARAFVAESNPQYKYTIGRVAVCKEKRSCGLGKIAMMALEEYLKKNGAKEMILSAQCQAQGFYQKLGYSPYGEIYLDEHCPHQSMIKSI